jgi:two-component system, OmpR family, response regulator MprA
MKERTLSTTQQGDSMEREQARILIVDDDPDILGWLRDVFIDEGYEVVAALSTHAALMTLEGKPFDCIVTDSLWFATSDRSFRDLRQVVAGAGATPVLLLTAYDEAARWVPAELGLAAILLKPIDLDELLNYVRTLVNRSSAPLT